ncbi:Crp/Fnr family transcriptional regulator [Lacinutrix neustonica]|uniref:Crp/Fnr family transcriptional regulator n=1 Tax=Lacinutrix neustonica TaxID=2980107 RepID=A0A9E8MXA8_9FLAO|nr:Crp/Fnr family transcriptional regulator [Lacinutrix neustonica]WAC02589.1 Crp/Fnr family transcriptional regulator [Lacinutrix neustonica]
MYEAAEYRKLEPGDKLLSQGKIPNKIYLILKGVVRAYLILENGKEVTTRLFNPYMFFASIKALLNKKPSSIIYEALTESEVLELDFTTFSNLCHNHLDVMGLYAKVLEDTIIRSEARFIEFSSSDATKRYLDLRKRINNLDNLIPQYQIAASIGITPVQLSRIRAKLN